MMTTTMTTTRVSWRCTASGPSTHCADDDEDEEDAPKFSKPVTSKVAWLDDVRHRRSHPPGAAEHAQDPCCPQGRWQATADARHHAEERRAAEHAGHHCEAPGQGHSCARAEGQCCGDTEAKHPGCRCQARHARHRQQGALARQAHHADHAQDVKPVPTPAELLEKLKQAWCCLRRVDG